MSGPHRAWSSWARSGGCSGLLGGQGPSPCHQTQPSFWGSLQSNLLLDHKQLKTFEMLCSRSYSWPKLLHLPYNICHYLWWSLSECRLPVHSARNKCLSLHPARQKLKSLIMIMKTGTLQLWVLNSWPFLLVFWWCRSDFCLCTCVLHSWPDPPVQPGILVWGGPSVPWW